MHSRDFSRHVHIVFVSKIIEKKRFVYDMKNNVLDSETIRMRRRRLGLLPYPFLPVLPKGEEDEDGMDDDEK